MEKQNAASETEYWRAEVKKVFRDFFLLFVTVAVVLIAAGTLAWFASNKEVGGNNMQISTEVPEYVQISVGRTTDHPLNDAADLLVLTDQTGEVQAPREQGDEGNGYDWSNRIIVSNYYRFGRLIPASSDSGEHILFTPDASGTGRNLKNEARFYLADGKKDGDLKALSEIAKSGVDDDSLMATAHVLASASEKEAEEFWEGYRYATSWYNTNDDGYYADIPVWLRTNAEAAVSLGIEGYVTAKNGVIVAETENLEEENSDALYKAVRVAILREQDSRLVPVASADESGKEKNVIPLQNVAEYGETGQSILDSKNYTVTRDTGDERDDGQLYGIRLADEEHITDGIRQSANYEEYDPYNGESVITLAAAGEAENGEWGTAAKLIIRIWLDGDDKDCWNETAGQDWSIHLRFYKLENNS